MDPFRVQNTFKRGESIFLEGATATGLYCIYEGTVKLVRIDRDGKERILGFLRPGEITGHRALLGAGTHTVSAVALEGVRVCYVPKSAFLSMLSADAALQSTIFRRLSEELRISEERFITSTERTVRQRLAEALLELKGYFGFELDGRTLDVRLRRTDIANLVGTTPESVARTFGEFRRAGIIEIDGRRIRIVRQQSLLREAGRVDPASERALSGY
jgi:CRP/FNR family transcriptional regulator